MSLQFSVDEKIRKAYIENTEPGDPISYDEALDFAKDILSKIKEVNA